MAGYSASARIERVPVRGRAHHPSGRAPGRPGRLVAAGDAACARDAGARPLGQRTRERLGYIADGWAQLTFYLTDPDSWR